VQAEPVLHQRTRFRRRRFHDSRHQSDRPFAAGLIGSNGKRDCGCEERSDDAVSSKQVSGGRAMDLGLRGRKALVTGASKGIGRACAEVLAEEGCDVMLVSRTEADLAAACDKIKGQHNVSVRYLALDLSDGRNVDKLATECA